jgi:hypothetical protein
VLIEKQKGIICPLPDTIVSRNANVGKPYHDGILIDAFDCQLVRHRDVSPVRLNTPGVAEITELNVVNRQGIENVGFLKGELLATEGIGGSKWGDVGG